MDELITKLFSINKDIASIKQNEIKPLEDRKKELEAKIFEALDSLGVDGTSLRGTGTVSITESVVPQAEDWDAFYDYIMEDKIRFCLLNKALNAAAFRETLGIEGEIPGLKPFTKRRLSVRKTI